MLDDEDRGVDRGVKRAGFGRNPSPRWCPRLGPVATRRLATRFAVDPEQGIVELLARRDLVAGVGQQVDIAVRATVDIPVRAGGQPELGPRVKRGPVLEPLVVEPE